MWSRALDDVLNDVLNDVLGDVLGDVFRALTRQNYLAATSSITLY